MEEAIFTVVLACQTTLEDVKLSLEHMENQPVRVVVFRVQGSEAFEMDSDEKITFLQKEYENVYQGYEKVLHDVETAYIQFCRAGDIPSEDAYRKIQNQMEKFEQDEETANPDILSMMVSFKRGSEMASVDEDTTALRDFVRYPEKMLVNFNNLIFVVDKVKDKHFTTTVKYDSGLFFMWQILSDNPYAYILETVCMTLSEPSVTNYTAFMSSQESEWYFETLEDGVLTTLKQISESSGSVFRAIQYGAYYEIQVRFAHNLNTKNKHVCDKRLDEFWNLCHDILQYIDDEIILNVGKFARYRCSNSMKMKMMQLKYGDDVKIEYVLEAATRQCCLTYNGIIFEKFNAQKISVDTINLDENSFVIECSFMDLTPREDYELHAILGEEELEIVDTKRFAEIQYFGVSVHDKRTFLVRVPYEKLCEDEIYLSFYAKIKGIEYTLKFESSRFPSRVTTAVDNAYWKGGGFLLRYNKPRTRLTFSKHTKQRRRQFERDYLKAIYHESRRSFLFRVIYWLTCPFFKNKRIWLTFDKMYKTGDNGEYFYRYALKQKDGIEVKYVANKGYPDTIKMQKEGLKPLLFSTLKQRLYFLHASVIAATHANIPVFSGTAPAKFMYTQDLLEGEMVCIQHGLAVQQLAHNLNSQYDNTKHFYCASPYEIKNLEQPAYGYYDKNMLSLVGLARYDGLINNDQRQILITPTWRSYISMPVSIGNTRPYSPDFKNTVYFEVFNSLIKNEKLLSTAKKCGYKIIYLLHPTISSQLEDFTPGDGAEVMSPVGVNYEQILTQSSLMVTDYSGVQFDFAYMRKPIVYYHTPKLPPHYEEGGFFYDTQGFGEICAEEGELVDTLCGYMENECKMSEFYKKRSDEFFAFNDHNNCERLYKEIMELDDYQRSIKTKGAADGR